MSGALSKYFLNFSRLSAVISAMRSQFHCPTTLWMKNLFLIPNSTLPLHNSLPFPQVLLLSPKRRAQGLPFCFPLEETVGLHEISLQSPLLWDEQNKRPHSLLSLLPLRPCIIFVVLFWVLSNSFMLFLYCGAQNCTIPSRESTAPPPLLSSTI